ncbi:MAG: hypothetical protein JWO30_2517 [Fibrobacteres bacterium]|nr:hypothetical protein [Fibrobacterota bacterium]
MRTFLVLATALFFQACGAGLFHGDRVTVDRDFIYLDDPVFLQSKSAYGQRNQGFFSFQLPIFFNANPQDSLRFGPGAVSVAAAAPVSPRSDSAGPDGRGRISCLVDTGGMLADPAAIGKRFQDSGRTLVLSPGRGGNAKVDLNFYCKSYDPPWGRTDTLFLAFRKNAGTEGFKDVAMSLPFHVSYRGPVVSIMVGLGLLYLFTQAGVLISGS